MSGNNSNRPVPRPKRRIADRLVPRAKVLIAPQPIPRPKHVLPRVEVAGAAGDGTGGDQTSAPGSSQKIVQGAQSGGNPHSSRSNKQKGSAETHKSKIQTIMKIRRRSDAGIKAESFGLNNQSNDIREEIMKGNNNLRRARDLLKEFRDNPPTIHATPNTMLLADLDDALRAAGRWLKGLGNNRPHSNRSVRRTRLNKNMSRWKQFPGRSMSSAVKKIGWT